MNISSRESDYLMAIYSLGGHQKPVRLVDVVKLLGVAKPTASLMIKKLEGKGLVVRDPGGIYLSNEGLSLCLRLIWRHGVVETALTSLGFEPEEACRIAKLIEQQLPEDAVERIWVALGKPGSCPHGVEFISTSKSKKTLRTCRPLK